MIGSGCGWGSGLVVTVEAQAALRMRIARGKNGRVFMKPPASFQSGESISLGTVQEADREGACATRFRALRRMSSYDGARGSAGVSPACLGVPPTPRNEPLRRGVGVLVND